MSTTVLPNSTKVLNVRITIISKARDYPNTEIMKYSNFARPLKTKIRISLYLKYLILLQTIYYEELTLNQNFNTS